ncbi:MAG: PspC domain-containing protein [Lentimicrobium sp.]|jgi:phage shock protein PspC (stress-responsive transcriptional regulator)|nr:PspC domain-containing protein [Lentimicrobium sp.]
MSQTRLYRTVQGRVIGGVSGGLADFFGMDPTIVRLIFVLLVIFGGSGVLLYIILWIILPEKNSYTPYTSFTASGPSPTGENSGIGEAYEGFEQGTPHSTVNETFQKVTEAQQKKKMEGSLIGGAILIVLGSIFLIERFIPRIDFGDLWPLLLISLGLILIFANLPRKDKITDNPGPGAPNQNDDQQTF